MKRFTLLRKLQPRAILQALVSFINLMFPVMGKITQIQLGIFYCTFTLLTTSQLLTATEFKYSSKGSKNGVREYLK